MAQGYGYRSEQRLRKENQDTFGVFEFGDVAVLVVCDGMGGHVGGRQASSIAVRTIHDELSAYAGGDPRGALRRAIEAANRAIYEMARKNYRLMGMGTTCVAAVVHQGTAHIAHVGDSRVYLVRDGQIRALTRDHTMVNLFVDAELLSPEDAATHPEAHVLSRSIGVERQVEVDLAEPVQLLPGDRLLLCSDGVHGAIGTTGLGGVDWRNPQEGVDAALAAVARAEGDDNATLIAFGLGISGTSARPTAPPDLASLEEEARQAPVQASLQPVRRPSAAPAVTPEPLEDVVPVDDEVTDPQRPKAVVRPAAPPRPRARPRNRSAAKVLVAGGGLLAVAALGLAAVFLMGDGPDAGQRPSPAPAEIAAAPAPAVEPPPVPTPTVSPPPVRVEAAALVGVDDLHGPTSDLLVAGAGSSGMFRARCLDCTSSLALPTAAAYLSGADDPDVAVAFFAPELPDAPQRPPTTQSAYNHPPPSGPEQTNAVRAARNKRCREALDTVRVAMRKSIDYASLYGAAWYCFNDTHTSALARARAATWSEFEPLLVHFEGTRDLPLRALAAARPAVDDEATDARRVDLDAPDLWAYPAEDGVEYRLALFEVDSDVQGFRDIVLDLLGEPTVADHLAADVLLEATAAAAVARMDDPSPKALQAWARRVYVASRAMTGPVGELVRAHRPDVAGMIEALLFEATGGDDGLHAIEEGYANDAVPPVVARAQAAGLAGQAPDVMSDLVALAEPAAPTASSWREADRSPRRRATSPRRRPTSGASRAETVPDGFHVKVWYPRERMPRVLLPYQERVELSGSDARQQQDGTIEVHRRDVEIVDPDWD